jgi:ComF family protein
VLASLVRDVLEFCYPCVCAHCNTPCEPRGFLCETCGNELAAIELRPACERCGAPLASDGMPCPFCLGKGIRNYHRVLRLGTFDEPLKGLIHQMKYHRQWAMAEQLAGRLLARESVSTLLAEVDVIVPVPLHFYRQFTRGYNQAALLARCISKSSGKPVAQPLKRVRHTESQTHQHSRRQRFDNLRNAFKLTSGDAIRGKRVLVIDDVMTTGATLKEIARALRGARPASLSALVLAVADPKHRGFQAV